MSRLDAYISEKNARKFPKKLQKKINVRFEKFNDLYFQYMILGGIESFVYFLVYVSVIGLIVQDFPVLNFITEHASTLKGFIGIPVLLVVLYILNRSKNALTTDAQCLASEIGAMVVAYEDKNID